MILAQSLKYIVFDDFVALDVNQLTKPEIVGMAAGLNMAFGTPVKFNFKGKDSTFDDKQNFYNHRSLFFADNQSSINCEEISENTPTGILSLAINVVNNNCVLRPSKKYPTVQEPYALADYVALLATYDALGSYSTPASYSSNRNVEIGFQLEGIKMCYVESWNSFDKRNEITTASIKQQYVEKMYGKFARPAIK